VAAGIPSNDYHGVCRVNIQAFPIYCGMNEYMYLARD